jgi:hypothetical protein
MSKKMCYGEICRNDEKIHLRTFIIVGLMVAIVIVAMLIIYSVITGTAFLNIPIFPTDL